MLTLKGEAMETTMTPKMDIILWKDSYCVGVPEIDAQHMELFRLTNRLTEVVEGGSTIKDIGEVLDDLFGYIEMHFETEESYTKNSLNFDEHKLLHIKFINNTALFVQRFLSGDADIVIPLLDFLTNWLKDHIMGTDKQAFIWLRKNGYV